MGFLADTLWPELLFPILSPIPISTQSKRVSAGRGKVAKPQENGRSITPTLSTLNKGPTLAHLPKDYSDKEGLNLN